MISKDFETVQEIIDEFNEVIGIYKAALERTNNPKVAYLETLYAHNCASLSKAGLWMPQEFLSDIFVKLWGKIVKCRVARLGAKLQP